MNGAEEAKIITREWSPANPARLWALAGLSPSVAMSRVLLLGLVFSVLVISTICLRNAIGWMDKPFAGFLVNELMKLGNVGRYHWTGTQAGLKYPDKILEANGIPVSSMKELNAVVQRLPIASPVQYAVERNSAVVKVVVPTMRFSLTDLIMTFGITFLPGLVFLLLGVLVFTLKPDMLDSWLFFLSCVFFSTYAIVSFDTQSSHWGFIRLSLFALTAFPAIFVHLSLVFPERKQLFECFPSLQILPYAVACSIVTPLEYFYRTPVFLPFYKASLLYLFFSAVIMVFSTLHVYKTSPSLVTRQRARVILLGAGLAFPLPMLALYLSFFGGAFFSSAIQANFLAIPALFFPAAIAYAIVKHNLFDLDALVRRTYGYVLSTAAIVGVYAALVSLVNLFFRSMEASRSPLFSLAFALAIAFFFNPLRQWAQNWIDRLFYRESVNLREISAQILDKLTKLFDADLIARTLTEDVARAMSLEHGCLFLLDPETGTYKLHAAAEDYPASVSRQQFTQHEAPVQALKHRTKPLFRHESETHPRYEPYREALQGAFRMLSAELILPVRYQEEMRGFVAFARKKSGRLFTVEDINLLTAISNAAAIALENASLFKENLEKRRTDEELKTARAIQVGMLPKHPPTIPGFQIAARSLPARMVGGDFYDFLEVRGEGPEPQLGIVVGDGSGKALSGALIMAPARSVLRAFAEGNLSAAAVMRLANKRLHKDLEKGSFVALEYAILDFRQRTLTLSNAGQPAPILCSSAQAEPQFIKADGDRFPLGIVKDSRYQDTCVTLQPGDTVVFYTDGVIEAMKEKGKMGEIELYEVERFMASVAEGKYLDAEALIEKLLADVARHVGGAEQHDDMILVVVKAE